ncbi:MAG: tyrosine-type recombinase/integrase [Burkholderiales bacterium]
MLSQAIDCYIAIRRVAGFDLKVQDGLLHNFARYAADRSQTHVHGQTAIDWAAQAPSPYQRENRLGMVRRFAHHARAEDPRHALVPRAVFAQPHRRTFPHIFSPDELSQLLEASARLQPRGSLRPHTYYALFGLLAATGLRISEAMHLLLSDVTTAGLVVRNTKFKKTRLVPLHPSTAGALERYLGQRQVCAGDDDHVFVSTDGRALSYAMINGTFHRLLKSVDLRLKPGASQPRIHSLRHRFAVRALEGCHGSREDVTRHVLALSTYLGHAHITDTYWYLQASPQLTRGIADACEARHEGATS